MRTFLPTVAAYAEARPGSASLGYWVHPPWEGTVGVM
jgi:hypothetical protein